MLNRFSQTALLVLFGLTVALNLNAANTTVITQTIQSQITPAQALNLLQTGNQRFVKNQLRNRDDFNYAIATSKHGQHPFAVVLACIDSRSDPTLLFDQHIGDIFIARVAGNVANTDNLASIEYSTLVAGAKLIVVMGHTQCGAVAAACKDANAAPGNLPHLLSQIEPAVLQTEASLKTKNCANPNLINAIAKQNVLNQIQQIYTHSPLIAAAVKDKKIMIVGAMHNLSTGKVTFFDDKGNPL